VSSFVSNKQDISEYNQTSFIGGMNLLLDDTRLQSNQYRVGYNVRNRYDVLDEIQNSLPDTSLPVGIVQEVITFGQYVLAFVSGKAYFRVYNQLGWTQIPSFSMSPAAPRYWTVAVPVTTTNWGRFSVAASAPAITGAVPSPNTAAGIVQTNSTAAASSGNIPGLLVQDNQNQPVFIFLENGTGLPVAITTQTYNQWTATYDSDGNLTVDGREYVPVGNCMAWANGILFIVDPTGSVIFRSVSGRPLDFMINVTTAGQAGGDAYTTDYSVGVSGISCIRPLATGGIFVAASNSNYAVTLNTTPNAPTIFGEYTFIRQYLFEATCLNDRCVIDSLGDTRFIALDGVLSFNAVEQFLNEGRNSPFTAPIISAFDGIAQDIAAAVLFNNYELYAVNTVFGPVIAVYDTINSCWSSFDTTQVGGKKIKQFAKIEQTTDVLFAVTEDNKLYQLYAGLTPATAAFLSLGISANMLYANSNIKLNNAKNEIKPLTLRCILNKITEQSTMTVTPIVDNRVGNVAQTKTVTYTPSSSPHKGPFFIPNVDQQLTNLYFPFPNCKQGWKVAYLISWTGGGSVTQFSSELKDLTPVVPLNTQASTV